MRSSTENKSLRFDAVRIDDLPDVAGEIWLARVHHINLLEAPMGSGKTTLCNALIASWGSNDAGSSPTFSLINEHLGPQGKLYHVDAYRIENEEEAFDLGFEEYLEEDCPIWIEWGRNVQSFLPYRIGVVYTTSQNEGYRTIEFYPDLDTREIVWNHE